MKVELGQIIAAHRRAQATGGGLEELVQTSLTRLLTTLGMVDGVASVVVLLMRMARAEWRRRRADKRAAD